MLQIESYHFVAQKIYHISSTSASLPELFKFWQWRIIMCERQHPSLSKYLKLEAQCQRCMTVPPGRNCDKPVVMIILFCFYSMHNTLTTDFTS